MRPEGRMVWRHRLRWHFIDYKPRTARDDPGQRGDDSKTQPVGANPLPSPFAKRKGTRASEARSQGYAPPTNQTTKTCTPKQADQTRLKSKPINQITRITVQTTRLKSKSIIPIPPIPVQNPAHQSNHKNHSSDNTPQITVHHSNPAHPSSKSCPSIKSQESQFRQHTSKSKSIIPIPPIPVQRAFNTPALTFN